jgi:hypothetical protein
MRRINIDRTEITRSYFVTLRYAVSLAFLVLSHCLCNNCSEDLYIQSAPNDRYFQVLVVGSRV